MHVAAADDDDVAPAVVSYFPAAHKEPEHELAPASTDRGPRVVCIMSWCIIIKESEEGRDMNNGHSSVTLFTAAAPGHISLSRAQSLALALTRAPSLHTQTHTV